MADHNEIIFAIATMAAVVYLTRISGYLIGLQIRHVVWVKPVLEALPGCAMIAILVPAVRQGSLVEIAALICVLALMWKTDNVVLATAIGMFVLIFGDFFYDKIG